MFKKIELDFSNINELGQMHQLLKEKFGFPDFYGKNVNALIDCWSDLRDIGEPGETMCDFNLGKNEALILECKNLSYKKEVIINHLLVAVESVNKREITWGNSPSLLLCLV